MNSVVELLRKQAPEATAAYSDAELTLLVGNKMREQGNTALEQQYDDFRTDYLNLRLMTSPGIVEETKSALKAGVLDQLPRAGYGLLALGAGESGLGKVEAWALGEAARNEQEAADRTRGRAISRWEDVSNPGTFARWALPTFAENAPQLGLTIGASALGTLATKNPLVGGAIAAGMMGVGQNAGDIYAGLGNREDSVVSRDEARTTAMIAGAGAGALDAVGAVIPVLKLTPAGQAMSAAFTKRFGRLAATKVAERAFGVMERGGFKGAAATFAAAAPIEGITERWQEAIAIAAEEHVRGEKLPDTEVQSRLTNAMAGGALVGGAVGGLVGFRNSSAPLPEVNADEAARPPAPGEETAPARRFAFIPPAVATAGIAESMSDTVGPTPIDEAIAAGRAIVPPPPSSPAEQGTVGVTTIPGASVPGSEPAPPVQTPPAPTPEAPLSVAPPAGPISRPRSLTVPVETDLYGAVIPDEGWTPIDRMIMGRRASRAQQQAPKVAPVEGLIPDYFGLGPAVTLTANIPEINKPAGSTVTVKELTDAGYVMPATVPDAPKRVITQAADGTSTVVETPAPPAVPPVDAIPDKPAPPPETPPPAPAPIAPPPEITDEIDEFINTVEEEAINLPGISKLKSLTKKALAQGWITEADARSIDEVQKGMGSRDDTSDAMGELSSALMRARDDIVKAASTPKPQEVPNAKVQVQGQTQEVAKPRPILRKVLDWSPVKAASTLKSAGNYVIAFTKPGSDRVHLRNWYSVKDGDVIGNVGNEMVRNPKARGAGRTVVDVRNAGFEILGRFKIEGKADASVDADVARSAWDAYAAENQVKVAAAEKAAQAVTEIAKAGEVATSGLAMIEKASPRTAAAVRWVSDLVTRLVPEASPNVAINGILAPMESVSAVQQRMQQGNPIYMLQSDGGKILGLFTNAEWTALETAIESGRAGVVKALKDGRRMTWGDAFIAVRFRGRTVGEAMAKMESWARKIANSGEARQAGRNVEKVSIDTEDAPQIAADEVPVAEATEPVVKGGRNDTEVSAEGFMQNLFIAASKANVGSVDQFKKVLQREGNRIGLPAFRTIAMETRAADVQDVYSRFIAEDSTSRSTLENAAAFAKAMLFRPNSIKGEDTRASGPTRVDRAVADREAYNSLLSTLAGYGIDLSVIEGAAGGRFDISKDGVMSIVLHVADMLNPTVTNLRVAVHESVHALFATLSPEMQSRVSKSVDRWLAALPEEAKARLLESNESFDNARSVSEFLEEVLAVSMERESVPDARSWARRVIAYLQEVWYRMGTAIATALGRTESAEDLANKWFQQRFDRMLRGELPDGFVEIAGGPLLTYYQQAMQLFGFKPGQFRQGGDINFIPPTSVDALDFNFRTARMRYSSNRDAFTEQITTENFDGESYGIDVDEMAELGGKIGRKIIRRLGVRTSSKEIEDGSLSLSRLLTGEGSETDQRAATKFISSGIDDAENSLPFEETVMDGITLVEGRTITGELLAEKVAQAYSGTIGGVTIEMARDVISNYASQFDSIASTIREGSRKQIDSLIDNRARYSRPVAPPVAQASGNREFREIDSNVNHSILNNGIQTEVEAVDAIARAVQVATGFAQTSGYTLPGLFRQFFGLPNLGILKQREAKRLDPVTRQPVQGANPNQRLEDFKSVQVGSKARFAAITMNTEHTTAIAKVRTDAAAELDRKRNQITNRSAALSRTLKEFLNADGLGRQIQQGIRRMLAAERWTADRAGRALGIVEQQIAQLEAEMTEPINRAYSAVFTKLFHGRLGFNTRNLFDILDRLVTEANIDFSKPIKEIRQSIVERAAVTGSPDLARISNGSPDANALLATVVAYAKTNERVLIDLERRKVTSVTRRLALERELAAMDTTREDVSKGITELRRAATLEERAKNAFRREREKIRVLEKAAQELEMKIAFADAALPVYKSRREALTNALGASQRFEAIDGATYAVPPTANASVSELEDPANQRTLNLTAGNLSDPVKVREDTIKMLEWLEARKAQGLEDQAYLNMREMADELSKLKINPDVVRSGIWSSTLGIMAVTKIMESFGTPIARRLSQRFRKSAALEDGYRRQAKKQSDRNNRLRAAAIRVLHAGRRVHDISVDRYRALFFEPATTMFELERNLLEVYDPVADKGKIEGLIWQKILNHLQANPETAEYIKGKEAEFMRRLRDHVNSTEEISKYWNDQVRKLGLRVKDARIIIEAITGGTTEAIRDAIPVGVKTFQATIPYLVRQMHEHMAKSPVSWQAWSEKSKLAAQAYEAGDKNAATALLAPFLDEFVWNNFIGGLAENPTYAMFTAPVELDGVTRPEADAATVAAAYRSTKPGDLIGFIERLHAMQNGKTDVQVYVRDMLGQMEQWWKNMREVTGEIEPGLTGQKPGGVSRMVPGAFIDSRTLERWPQKWRQHIDYDGAALMRVVQRVAAEAAYGRDQDALEADFNALQTEVDLASNKLGIAERNSEALGGTKKEIIARTRKAVGGDAEYRRLSKMRSQQAMVERSKKMLVEYYSADLHRTGSERLLPAMAQTLAGLLLNQPGSALLALHDIFAPFVSDGVSRATAKQILRSWGSVGESLAGSFAAIFAVDISKFGMASRHTLNYERQNLGDPLKARKFLYESDGRIRSDILNEPERLNESKLVKNIRRFPEWLQIPLNFLGEASKYPVATPFAIFRYAIMVANRAMTFGLWSRVESMVERAMVTMEKMTPAERDDPAFRVTAKTVGLKGQEAFVFDRLAASLYGYDIDLTELARKALTRKARPGTSEILDDHTRFLLNGMASSEIALESNIGTMSPAASTNTALRVALPLWGWPIRRAMQVAGLRLNNRGEGALDINNPFKFREMGTENRVRLNALSRGMISLALATSIGLAYSILLDEYHEKLLGKKRNLRSPLQLAQAQNGMEVFMTVLEGQARVGTFGAFGDLANGLVNVATGEGDNRGLSLDRRVVAVNSIMSGFRSISALVAQREADYNNVIRPALSATGGSFVLQYMQMANKLLGMNQVVPGFENIGPEVEWRTTRRINAGNILRVAGRTAGVEVRKQQAGGGYSIPTRMTPKLNRMVLATYAGDVSGFKDAWREAVILAKELGHEDPRGYVRDAFRQRHPLRSVFRSLTTQEYRNVIGQLDADNRADVEDAVRWFNAFGQSLGIKPYSGSEAETSATRARLAVGF